MIAVTAETCQMESLDRRRFRSLEIENCLSDPVWVWMNLKVDGVRKLKGSN